MLNICHGNEGGSNGVAYIMKKGLGTQKQYTEDCAEGL